MRINICNDCNYWEGCQVHNWQDGNNKAEGHNEELILCLSCPDVKYTLAQETGVGNMFGRNGILPKHREESGKIKSRN